MVSFQQKKINRPSGLGDYLREARLKEHWSVEKVAQFLGIASKYVRQLEGGALAALPGQVYTKNFIKKYAALLKIDSAHLLDKYTVEHNQPAYSHFTHRPRALSHLGNIPNILRYIFALTIVGGLLIYLGIHLSRTFSPPLLEISAPFEGAVVTESRFLVQGKTAPETRVQINGREVISNIHGHFEESINLNPGLNTIIILAIKKYGQMTSLNRHIIFLEK